MTEVQACGACGGRVPADGAELDHLPDCRLAGWETWLADAEITSGVRIVSYSSRYKVPTPAQLAKIREQRATPILMRRDDNAIYYMGLLDAYGVDRLDNDCNPVGQRAVPDTLIPDELPLDDARRADLVADLIGKGWSLREISRAVGWSKHVIERLAKASRSAT